MTEKSIGLLELSSVVAGFLVADAALKAGTVRLVLSRSICSGKYMVLVAGDPERSHRAQRTAEGVPVDEATWGEILGAARKLGVDPAAVQAAAGPG